MTHFYQPTLPAIALLCCCMLIVTSCDIFGGGGDDSLTISGTLTIPANSNITNTEVLACFVDNTFDVEQCNHASPHTQRVFIEESGNSSTYRIDDLAEGKYDVRALKDFSGNGWWDFRDADCNLNGEGRCDYFEPSVRDLDLDMRAVENDFRLRITAPEGVDLPGTQVGFCFLTENYECDENESFLGLPTTFPWEPGENYGGQWFSMTPGDYALWAEKDVNGDGEPDFGGWHRDLFGDIRIVQPGSLIVYTIHMEPIEDAIARVRAAGVTSSPLSPPSAQRSAGQMSAPASRQ